ncbi:MAG TPA: hypothetical protein VFU12_17360 [Glycomyces sp.]|nr:hypothetical protein [Glycomyces sp.]
MTAVSVGVAVLIGAAGWLYIDRSAMDAPRAGEAPPTVLTGQEVAAMLCETEPWAEHLVDAETVTVTETQSTEAFEEGFKCELLLQMRTGATSGSEIGLRLQISGRRPATLTAYETALAAGEGTCEALRAVGGLPPSEDPAYLSEIDTGQGDPACLSDFRSIVEAWTVSGDWYLYLLLVPEPESRELVEGEDTEVRSALVDQFADVIVPVAAGCAC